MCPETVGDKKKPQFFYGWVIVLVSFLSDLMTTGATLHSFSFILKPMTQELGWTRTITMVGAGLKNTAGAFGGIIIGPLLDRYGARPLMVVGAVVGGIGIIALSRVNELWQFYLLYGLIGSMGITAIGGLVTSSTVVKWFIRKRSRATAITVAGSPLGGAVLGPITQYIILQYGWRAAWAVLGSLIWIVVIPLAGLFMRRQPEDMGLYPDGDKVRPEPGQGASATDQSSPKLEEVWTPKAALRTPTLWVIILSFVLSGMGMSANMYHQTAYISDKGLPSSVLTTNIVVFGITAALAFIPWAFAAEKFAARYCVAASFFGCAGGLAILVAAQSMPAVLLYAVVYPLAASGGVLLEVIMLANYYGRTFIGTIRGVIMPLRLISTVGGPLFAAYIYDVTKSYDLAYIIFGITYLLAAFVILMARPPKPQVKTVMV